MSSMNTSRGYLLAAGKILLLLIAVTGAWQSGIPASYLDPNGILFILVGGVALMMISFPGAEIWSALRHAAGGSGSDTEIGNSTHFWEAAGRSFWILGGLSSILYVIIGFDGMKTSETAGLAAILPMLIRALLSTLYGGLLAVICFVPCWKLMGKLQNRLSARNPEQNKMPISVGRPGWRFGMVLGYILFLAALVWTIRTLNLLELQPIYLPALLVVVGGALALILFRGENNTRLTPSAAFAGMGLIGSLMGFIQMLHGMSSPQGVPLVAGAVAFVLFAGLIALLGMTLIGAPLEDRAIRIGRTGSSSAFSRVSWYVFPLLSLAFLILVFHMITTPLPGAP